MEGWIKLHRQIIEHPVFSHQTALKIWIWCLIKANHSKKYVSLKIGRGETIVEVIGGQFIFGRFKAEEELGIDGSSIYRWIKKFEEEYDLINIDSNNQYSIITICKWDTYQDYESQNKQPKNNQRTTNEPHLNNQRTTFEQPTNTNKNDKNDKNDKNEIETPPVFPNVVEAFTYNCYETSKEIGCPKIVVKEFIEHWTGTDEITRKYLWQSQSSFNIKTRLKNWLEVWKSKQEKTNGKETPTKASFILKSAVNGK